MQAETLVYRRDSKQDLEILKIRVYRMCFAPGGAGKIGPQQGRVIAALVSAALTKSFFKGREPNGGTSVFQHPITEMNHDETPSWIHSVPLVAR